MPPSEDGALEEARSSLALTSTGAPGRRRSRLPRGVPTTHRSLLLTYFTARPQPSSYASFPGAGPAAETRATTKTGGHGGEAVPPAFVTTVTTVQGSRRRTEEPAELGPGPLRVLYGVLDAGRPAAASAASSPAHPVTHTTAGPSVTGLCPHTPETSPQLALAIIARGPPPPWAPPRPQASRQPVPPPSEPEGPPGPSLSPVGPGVPPLGGSPIREGPLASMGACTVSLSPHRPATPPGADSSRTGRGVLGATGTGAAADAPALGLRPQGLGTPPAPVSCPASPGASGPPTACPLSHGPGKAAEAAVSPADRGPSGATGNRAAETPSHRLGPPREPPSWHVEPDTHNGGGHGRRLTTPPQPVSPRNHPRRPQGPLPVPQAWGSPVTRLSSQGPWSRPRRPHRLLGPPHTGDAPAARLPPRAPLHTPQAWSASRTQAQLGRTACLCGVCRCPGTRVPSSAGLYPHSLPPFPESWVTPTPSFLFNSARATPPPVLSPAGPTTWGSPTAPSTHTAPGSPAASAEPAAPGVPEASGPFAPAAPAASASALLPRGRRQSRRLSALTQRVSHAEVVARRPAPRPRGAPAAPLFPHGLPRPRPGRLGPTQRPAAPLMAAGPPAPPRSAPRPPPAAGAAAHTHARARPRPPSSAGAAVTGPASGGAGRGSGAPVPRAHESGRGFPESPRPRPEPTWPGARRGYRGAGGGGPARPRFRPLARSP
ncbi:basic proline-rich protein-like [Panthera leo]|uniref:basic proline-rich protein-like n=1 Tax=Panthera leo TaxID=9689 RepID=UPI001C6A60B8|nr:basic proline-rich protein-like [Panthera leo]